MKRWLFLLCAPLAAQVIPIDCFEQAQPILDQADTNTLIIFDVDLVLLMPADPAFQPANVRDHRALFKQETAGLSAEERYLAKNIIIQTVGATLVQESAPQLIWDLQCRGIPTIALTGALSGTCCDCDDLQHDRFNTLAQFGIDFSQTYPWVGPLSFDSLPGHANRHPLYNRGILYCNGKEASKGEVLAHFFDAIHLRPLKVILFDDLIINHQTMEEMLEARGIEFIGFHYLRTHILPAEPVDPECLVAKWRCIIEQAKEHTRCCQLRGN